MNCGCVVENLFVDSGGAADTCAIPLVFQVLLGVLALAVAIALPPKRLALPDPFRPSVERAAAEARPDSVLTDREIKRLMRYHGVLGLRITADQAYIKRNRRWLCVFHDPPTPAERTIVGRAAAPSPPDPCRAPDGAFRKAQRPHVPSASRRG